MGKAELRALEVIQGCSNWFDIKHFIYPRVLKITTSQERLLAALKMTAHNAADGSGLCWCVVDDRVFGHHQKCTSIRRVLNEVEPKVAITQPVTPGRE